MVEIFEQIAQELNYTFLYARRDYANISTDDTTKRYFIADAIKRDSKDDETIYKGGLMLLRYGGFDNTYIQRYNENIKPILENEIKVFKKTLYCENVSIKELEITDAINLLDGGLDGVLIKYTLEK